MAIRVSVGGGPDWEAGIVRVPVPSIPRCVDKDSLMVRVYFTVNQDDTGLRFLTPSSLALSTSGERAPRKVRSTIQVSMEVLSEGAPSS